jgi:hypothetical protein
MSDMKQRETRTTSKSLFRDDFFLAPLFVAAGFGALLVASDYC